ncbi:MAG: hypothetical protein CSYNP_02832 [Syntrophus sp. SKADARSKE-3]|nr:hypothetical protein [Syntrophus sp. SKADARSKE-3]
MNIKSTKGFMDINLKMVIIFMICVFGLTWYLLSRGGKWGFAAIMVIVPLAAIYCTVQWMKKDPVPTGLQPTVGTDINSYWYKFFDERKDVNGKIKVTLAEISGIWMPVKNGDAKLAASSCETQEQAKVPSKLEEIAAVAANAAMKIPESAPIIEAVPVDAPMQEVVEVHRKEVKKLIVFGGRGTQLFEVEEDDYEFQSDSVNRFFSEKIMPKTQTFGAHPERLRLAILLLHLLDRYGDCSSVVSSHENNQVYQGEPNEAWRKDEFANMTVFDVLREVTLRDHSIETAILIEETHRENSQVALFIIEALAHDIGKIPEFRTGKYQYVTGDHPVMSKGILSRMSCFNDLPKDEQNVILEAVGDHHILSQREHVRYLRTADQLVRAADMQKKMLIEGANASDEAVIEQIKQRAVAPSGKVRINSEDEDTPPTKRKKEQEEFKRNVAPVDVSFLDIDQVLEEIDPLVNYIETENSGRYRAFSMKNDEIYVWTDLIREAAIKVAGIYREELGEAATLLSHAGSRTGRQSIISALVERIKKEDADPNRVEKRLVPNKVKDGYFSAPFVLTLWNEEEKRETQKYLKGVVFRAQAFGGKMISEFEARKTDELLNIRFVDIDRRTAAEKGKS